MLRWRDKGNRLRGGDSMTDLQRLPVSRRRFLQMSAAAAVLAACNPTGQNSSSSAASGSSATPSGSSPGGGSPSGAAISGTVNVSYPDEAGFKPKYVEQAAAAVKQQFSGVDVKIDLQKIGDDAFYTKLLLRFDSGDVPDVIHVGGSLIGELSDAGYIEPLDT